MMNNIPRITKLLVLLFTISIISCQNEQSSTNIGMSEQSDQKGKVKEVVQTSSYTYLRVEKNNHDEWIAINKQDIKEGAIIYYVNGLKMENFTSPELKRTFESVYFIQEISDKPILPSMPKGMLGTEPKKPVLSKLDIKIEQPDGGTSIGELYANRDSYSGKSVKVKGQVTKVNLAILDRNWVHIQDGTTNGENFDLTVTTEHVPQVGDVVTYSGTLTLNKDFGSGYSYELLLENASTPENL
jgi:hypothetical protein